VPVGLVGCGTIGSQLARAIQRDYRHVARLVALNDCNHQHAVVLQHRLTPRPPICSLSALIRKSQLVLEAASAEISAEVVRRCLRANRDVMVMSVGGLLGDRTWQRLARRSRGRLYVPSGALAGIDGIKAMAVGRIRRVWLTTRKPPRALASAPYVQRRHLQLTRLTRPSVIFEGPPADAVRAFPQNTNVAAALALASGKVSRTRIRVVADPAIYTNVHEVDVEGDCGRVHCRIESRPSPNPKTSEIAVRSAIATLQRIFDPVSIGT
jgi:aspartate dehydrogenase